jgi:catechol 2,3-dioxygenase-like lactoylglutathione lyase family enzyme
MAAPICSEEEKVVDISTASGQQRSAPIPTPSAFSHISLPSRDIGQSKRFFTEVLGGELIEDEPNVKVQLGSFKVALGLQDGGATAPHREHPHYAFTVPPENFLALKLRLEAYGVPTHEPWTRAGSPCALMYFRDPSGNQFEMYCSSGFTDLPLRVGARAGGDYTIPFPSLVYRELKDPGVGAPSVRFADFNHMTIPSKDLQESKRFLKEIFGGEVTIDHPSHVTVKVAGAEIGNGGPLDGGWTEPDAEYPHYTFLVAPENMVPLKERLESYGVPTSDVFTRTGTDASVYYRDPTGNLWELCCQRGFAGSARRTRAAGGDYAPDLRSLCYGGWNDPGQ